ncbi:MAG: class I SAM-dependent methyltransferase [Dehalococcoidia bacterium]
MTPEEASNRLRPGAAEAFTAYTTLVLANRMQVERLRTAMPGEDFWEERANGFRPGAMEADEVARLVQLARPEDTWLDIGAGGGRFAVPLSRSVARVVAIEPSPAMRGVLGEAAKTEGCANIEVVDLHWPPPADADAPAGDVCLAANVLYDADDLQGFLAAMEARTRRECVVLLSDRAPSTPDTAVWEGLYGESPHALPGLREFLAVLGALGRRFEVVTYPVRAGRPVSLDDALEQTRWRYWTQQGSPAEARLRTLLQEHYRMPSGEILLPPRRNYSAVVNWRVPQADR